jgi:hypothetical protein
MTTGTPSDHDALTALNTDYINAIQNCDVKLGARDAAVNMLRPHLTARRCRRSAGTSPLCRPS